MLDKWEAIKSGVGNAINGVIEAAKELIPGIIEGTKSGWDSFINWLPGLWKGIVDGFKNFFGIHSPSTVMAEMGKYIIEGLLNGIKSLVPNVQEIWNSMKQAAVDAWNSAKETLLSIWESTKETAIQTWESIKQSLSDKWENLKTSAKDTFNNIKEKIKESWTGIKENVKDSAENVKTNVSNAWTKAKESTSTAWSNIKSKAVSVAQSMAGSIKEKFGSIQSTIKNFGSSAIIQELRDF